MKQEQLTELLYQALATEKGGVLIYRAALECVLNEDLKGEVEKYLAETEQHVRIVEDLCAAFGLDTSRETPGSQVVTHIGQSLVTAMEMARRSGPPEAAELVAVECIVHAETKDHMNWELLGECLAQLSGAQKKALADAYKEVEDQEDEHLYHSTGWARELWIQSLGMKAVLPPPEEEKDVKTAIGAARAKHARKEML
jgi:rubrerythrin